MKGPFLRFLARHQIRSKSQVARIIRTEYFPPFAQSFTVLCVDDVYDGMALVVVPMPDGADTTLAAQVPELKNCGWQRDLTH